MKYIELHFDHAVTNRCDTLMLRKIGGSDWCHIVMDTNGEPNGNITIRSREQLEQLGFMIKQVLDRCPHSANEERK